MKSDDDIYSAFSDEQNKDNFDSDEIGSLEDGENNEVSRPYSNSFNGIS
jgi:hypothetical protein